MGCLQPCVGTGREGSLKGREKAEECLCAMHISCFLYGLKIDLDLARLAGVCESCLDTNPDIRSNFECI